MDESAGNQAAGPSTVFHLTHWKAGSQWVRGVLASAQPDRFVEPTINASHFLKDPIVPGGIYSPLYVDPNFFNLKVGPGVPHHKFFVMRDLRDAIVSWYFSAKISHSPDVPDLVGIRAELNSMGFEDGMAHLISERLNDYVAITMGWLREGVRVFRYEDLLADEQETFRLIFEHCGIDVPDERRRQIVAEYSFERLSGRKRGQEDRNAHQRKGVAGDWRNRFSERLKDLFKAKWGAVLIKAGYEQDHDW